MIFAKSSAFITVKQNNKQLEFGIYTRRLKATCIALVEMNGLTSIL